VLPALIDPRDPVLAHGLACSVKYVRLVRRKLGERVACTRNWCARAPRIVGRSTRSARASWAWIWDLPPSRSWPSRQRSSRLLPRGGPRYPSATSTGPATRPPAPRQQPGPL
jgi:hypothetical protein